VRITKGERQFVAECLDLPVVTQAARLDELVFNIREAIGLHLEVNVMVPNIPDGDAAVVAAIGGVQTQTGVLITIRQY
jgi:predicted RNase H-like HicB family nuclease